MSSFSSRTRSAPAGFIEPCLPSPADRPPSGANWIHEIKHDGYRLMARRDPVGIRLLTRRGNDWSKASVRALAALNRKMLAAGTGRPPFWGRSGRALPNPEDTRLARN